MVNDLASKAYMMINHHLEEFVLVSNKNDDFYYSNQNFSLKVSIDQTESEDSSNESYHMKGVLVLEDLNKNKREIRIFGDCGW